MVRSRRRTEWRAVASMKELWNNLVVRVALVARLRGQTLTAYDTLLRCYRDLRFFIRAFLTPDAAARLVVRHRSPTDEFAPFEHVSEIKQFLAIAATVSVAVVGFIVAILGPVEPPSEPSVAELAGAPAALPSINVIVSRQSTLDTNAVNTFTVRNKPSSEINVFRQFRAGTPAGLAFINDTSNSVVDKSAGDKFDLRASAALYEESSDNPGGQRYKGSTTWRLETGMDEKFTSDPTVHALVEIPQHMQIDLSLRPNPDPRIPASHFIEIRFSGSEPIASISGIVLKDAEQATGQTE